MKTLLLLAAALAALPLHAQTLQEQLEVKRREFAAKAPPDRAAIYQAGIESVAASGIYQRAKKTGEGARTSL